MSRDEKEPPAPLPIVKTKTKHDNGRFLISDLCTILETYLEPDQVKQVYKAYLFSASAHDGQVRMTGEPYIYHPLAVARVLAEMHMDTSSIMAAILHDVMEDTPATREDLAEHFGETVAGLVDGVSKLTHLKFRSKAEAQAESFRKMMLAMSQDIRVILVKLADRLHNMRTLGVMRPAKKRRIARETLDIYAPIAQRLGMRTIRRELEQLCFEAHYPMRYRVLSEAVKSVKGRRKELVSMVEATIAQRLEEQGIKAIVTGREKNLYSIYRKMQTKHLSFKDLYDVFAFRIVVNDIDTCYRSLGAIHTLYKPLPGRFKDYIAIPKANGYQSLHTALFGPHGVPIEVQTRTHEMDLIAEEGIAAHWYYKGGESSASAAQRRASEWLKNLMDLQQNTGNALEFMETVKVDLFPDEVYVFTPRGDIMALPRGATGIDFAYAVHTDIGNSCVAVKVDHKLRPLSAPLESGQTVEVIKSENAHPRPVWLNYATTAKARTNIRHYLKTLQSAEAVKQGKVLLSHALEEEGLELEGIPEETLTSVIEQLEYPDLDDMYKDIGMGNRIPSMIARLLGSPDEEGERVEQREVKPLTIKGTEGLVVDFGRCCSPIPGDDVVGMMTAGRGMVIHRCHCGNVHRAVGEGGKVFPVQWAEDMDSSFPANVRALTQNQRGVLANMASAISRLQGDILDVSFSERDSMSTSVDMRIAVRDRKHLADIIRSLRIIPEVMKISRT
ncbi:MAG: bifunctional GTP diphosphokinase/guanosine-3',5'-bis pyrophosphate 3'-pyrophosphohydrolase [bacterium]